MIDFEKIKKYAICAGIFILLGAICVGTKLLFNFVGDPRRANEIYEQALEDFKEENYSNAYFQFSKVSYLSDLKPYAIYHRAECAKALNDYKSEQKQYYLLFNIYPKNELALRAKYLWATDNISTNPKIAQKYLEEIITKYPNSDYSLGAKYHLATLLNQKHNASLLSTSLDKGEITNYLREYLTNAPSGRWALKAAELWQNITPDITDEDKLILAETYCLYNLANKAEAILVGSDFNKTWAKQARIALMFKENGRAKSIVESGLKQKNSAVAEQEKNDIILKVLQVQKNKSTTLDAFLKAAESKNDIFLKVQKCKYTTNDNAQNICYSNIIKNNDIKSFSEKILSDLFIASISNGQYSTAKKLGLHYIENYKDGENTDQITYWLGCISKNEKKTNEANDYFKQVIINYPDSYYAFRSYLKLNDIKNSIITTIIEPQNTLFPYYGKTNATIIKLVEMDDLEILSQIYENDKFVQSWILYEKGEKSKAMCIARDAMIKLKQKPEKSDLRWRLVYPTFMYDEIKQYAQDAGNNAVLMLALTREESYFNENAHSYVGAVGLMQLMPKTAKEINRIKGLGMQSLEELHNANTNLKLGNHYYNFLLTNLGGNNILSTAAYNGGIGSISKWKKGLEYRDIDEFIEKIPYTETRNYVKKVFRTYWNYARLYL